jgi:uncharacterized membrane protein YfcA
LIIPDWFLILLIVFFAAGVSSIVGFADALIAIPLLGLILDTRIGIILWGFWGILVMGLNFIRYFKNVDWKYVKTIVVYGIPGIIIGALLIGIISVIFIDILLGFFIILFILAQLFKHTNHLSKGEVKYPILMLSGFVYGVLGGLIGASGPISVITLEATHHEKENFIGTFAAVSVPLTIIKLTIYLISGLFPVDLWWIYLLGFPIILLASRLGHWITPWISLKHFRILILIMLFLIGIQLIISALTQYF